MSNNPRRIDVHHHLLPPKYVQHLADKKLEWTGGPVLFEWSPEIAREVMEKNGIAAAMASPVPSMFWGDEAEAAHWATYCNEYSARVVHDDPRHFGGLATLPLPDVAASCRELSYALDVLGLDGVILWASQGERYLGDPDYEELMAELDRRGAVVLIHPHTAPPGSDVPKLHLPKGLIEFMADTSRAVGQLLFNGVFERYPNIRWIVSHAGAFIPYIAWRLRLGMMLPHMSDRLPKGTDYYLQRLYYDTALSPSEQVLAALRQFVPASQILFGSDYPLVMTPKVVEMEANAIDTSKVLDNATRKAINRDNALKLFPRFDGSPSTMLSRVARGMSGTQSAK